MGSLKRLSNQFFTFLPERLGSVWIQRISANSFANGADIHIFPRDFADVAILAITAADLVSRSNYGCPNRSCRSLRNRLPLEGSLALCCKLLIHLIDHRLYAARIQMAAQLGVDASRMYGRGAYPTLPMAPVESNREEDVCCLRAAVSDERLVRRPFEVGILEIDVGEAVACGRQVDQPSSCAD